MDVAVTVALTNAPLDDTVTASPGRTSVMVRARVPLMRTLWSGVADAEPPLKDSVTTGRVPGGSSASET